MSSFSHGVISLRRLVDALRQLPAMQSKIDIQASHRIRPVSRNYDADLSEFYALPGDDCAAIKTATGYQLLAMEGMLPQFVANAPWFAGWSAVMANISDIIAMGGRPSAVVNAYWHHDVPQAQTLLQGIQDACDAYGVANVGGHTSISSNSPASLAVAIMGEAGKLLSNLHVRPQQRIMMAVNLKGQWHGNTAYWKCFEQVEAATLRAQLAVIPQLADEGKLIAARDISNAGVLGTLLMLLEATNLGASIDVSLIPRPDHVDMQRWLSFFPSYGFLFCVDAADVTEVGQRFAEQGICCREIGSIHAKPIVDLFYESQHVEFWNFEQQAFTGLNHVKFVMKEHSHAGS